MADAEVPDSLAEAWLQALCRAEILRPNSLISLRARQTTAGVWHQEGFEQ
jgi:hypothetical protein